MVLSLLHPCMQFFFCLTKKKAIQVENKALNKIFPNSELEFIHFFINNP